MKKAKKFISNTEVFNINEFSKNNEPVNDNTDVHNFLENEMVGLKDICGQDTYIFSDGSYITRLEDDYFYGDDVTMFEIEEEL